jgi:dihydrofolate synthase/folylpolyglutamate synthase
MGYLVKSTMSYDDAIGYLYGLQAHGMKFGLDNIRALLRALGCPERAFRSVHIAGTNGKGTTAAALAGILASAGRKTGLFTSPHLVSFTERIRVGGREISPGEVVALAREVRDEAARAGLAPTFFEVVTAMGFLHFARAGVEWAVVETGLGGRLDATNTLLPEVSVITRIGMDHAEFLGGTIPEVAREKAGIIKEGVPVVSYAQEPAALAALAEKAGRLDLLGRDFFADVTAHGREGVTFTYRSERGALESLSLPLGGAHQAGNAALAVRAFELLGIGPAEPPVRTGLAALHWPGRLELAHRDPDVIIDGAHNPEAVAALARTLAEDCLRPGERVTLVFGAMADKDSRGMLLPLIPLAAEIVCAAPAFGRAARPEALAALARSLGHGNVTTAPTPAAALALAVRSGRTVVVTGSFYMVGAVREALGHAGFEIGLRE